MAIFNCYVSSPEGINHLSWLGHHFADVPQRRKESGFMKRVQTMPDIQIRTLSTSEAWLKTSKDTLQQQRYIYIHIWVNYNELTTSSLEIIVSKGNHPQMALIQVSELL